jgi:hypothetical protein
MAKATNLALCGETLDSLTDRKSDCLYVTQSGDSQQAVNPTAKASGSIAHYRARSFADKSASTQAHTQPPFDTIQSQSVNIPKPRKTHGRYNAAHAAPIEHAPEPD